MVYYHGTSLKNAENILKTHSFFIENTAVGTLGFGAYAFEYSKQNAIEFAANKWLNKKNSSIAVISFKIDNSQVWDLSDPRNIEFLHNYIENHKEEIDALSLLYKNNTNGYSKKLDGAIIDSFIDEMKKDGIYILGIKGPTENHIGRVRIKQTGIPNSVELCLKNNEIIEYDTMRLLEGDDLI